MNKKKYKYLIFDADHTLLDFEKDEKEAFKRTFEQYQISYTEKNIQDAFDYSAKIWDGMGLNNVELSWVQEIFHSKYVDHIPLIFENLKKSMNFKTSLIQLKDTFIEELAKCGHPIENSLEIFKSLSNKYLCCIATNGIDKIQRGRLKEFLPYTEKLFISENINTIKPNEKFFNWMLDSLQVKSEECLMIGDSLSSDIKGANKLKMDTCWFNCKSKENKTEIYPTYMITKLNELKNIVE